jgi:formate dehydrogenase major subunit
VTLETARGEVEARALVTRRMRPFTIDGKTVHQVGLPWHWGYQGLARGDVSNDISSLVADPNVSIHEGKVFSCNVRPGHRSAPAPELFQQKFAQQPGQENQDWASMHANQWLGEVYNG